MSFSSLSHSVLLRQNTKTIAQTTVDAKLQAKFEESGTSFDYSNSVRETRATAERRPPKPDGVTTAYLHQLQKGKMIQPFGCLLALDEKTYKVIAYSENAAELLTMANQAVPSVGDHPVLGIGSDISAIFTAPSAATLHKALEFRDVTLLNPILVHCKTSGNPFYAIAHRVRGSLIVDLEPVSPHKVPIPTTGPLQSYKLAAKAITRLQSLPSGSMERLCDAMVQEVFELTGYDRVMAYKFHEDDHGEVIAEITKPGLEPYLGLHYPATDLPQASRFLFIKNKVRMIVDCRAKYVKVLQDEKLLFDLTLCGSTMRAPHSCHSQYMKNMNSIASLVMAVVINEGEGESEGSDSAEPRKRKRLWGLVVCHNTTPRFVPFPLRYACEFLAQVFAIHVNKVLELEDQIVEKHILRTRTLLCDLLMRDAPLGIVSHSPNIMDLVKCDGAAFFYKNQIWGLGMRPTDSQLHEIILWLSEHHMDSTSFFTDSLYDAGFPGVNALDDAVCGMAAVRITLKDMIFWFRAHTATEIKWGGAKHEPGEKDDGKRMHPRSSFIAFLEVAKKRSLPWKDYEMDAIHSFQLMLRNSFKEKEMMEAINTRLVNLNIEGMQQLEAASSEMARLIETATVPVLAVDVDGLVNGWNMKIAELTGLPVEKAIGKHLLALVEDTSIDTVQKLLCLTLQGEEEKNIQFDMKRYGSMVDAVPVSLVVNACASRDLHHNIVGVCFVAQDITGEKIVVDKFTRIQGDYKAIVQNPNPLIPPIFGSDEFGWCSEWNLAMTKLTGWRREEVINKMLLGEVFGIHSACCRLKNREAFFNLGIVLNKPVVDDETEKVPFGFFCRSGDCVDCLLSVTKKVNKEGVVTGVFCFLQLASLEQQQALRSQRLSVQTLTYTKYQIKNSLNGIIFARNMLEATELGSEQKKLLHTSSRCLQQLSKVLDDSDFDNLIDGCLDLETVEFTINEILTAVFSQITVKSNARGVQIVDDVAEGVQNEALYGDSLRLQQVLVDFFLVSIDNTPSGGQVVITGHLNKAHPRQIANLELSITHTGTGVSEAMLKMYGSDIDETEEGISLFAGRRLLKLMNGDVHYLQETGKCSFVISIEVAMSSSSQA